MPNSTPIAPLSVLVAAGLTAAASVFMIVMGIGSAVANPTALGLEIAAVLLAWGAVLAASAIGMARTRRWARGPVVAAGLLHLASFASFVPSQPWALVGVLVAAATVAAALWPSTTRALRLGAAAPDRSRRD